MGRQYARLKVPHMVGLTSIQAFHALTGFSYLALVADAAGGALVVITSKVGSAVLRKAGGR